MMAHSGACVEARAAFVAPPPKRCVIKKSDAERVFDVVHAVTGFDQPALVGPRKFKKLVHARWLFVLAFSDALPGRAYIGSQTEIARILCCDHTTIWHAQGAARSLLRAESARSLVFRGLVADFRAQWARRAEYV